MAENTYTILTNLRDYEYKLLNTNSIQDLDILLLKIKSYIFSNNDLKNKYINRIENFYNSFSGGKYTKNINNAYDTFKNITRKIGQNKNIKIVYPLRPHNPYCPNPGFAYSRKTENKHFYSHSCYDYKDKCVYPSVLMPYMNYEDSKYYDIDSNIFSKIKVKSDLSEFYAQFSQEYRYINFPQDLEFFLSTTDTYNPQYFWLFNFTTLCVSPL